MLARSVLVPLPIPTNDFQKRVSGSVPVATGVEDDGEVQPRLVVAGVLRERLPQLGFISGFAGQACKFERGPGRRNRRV